MNDYRIATTCVQGGYRPKNGEPRQIPIIQSTTFKYDTGGAMGRLFDLEDSGLLLLPTPEPHLRHRGGQGLPRWRAAAQRCSPASGHGGQLLTPRSTSPACGDHIVSSASIYGGTYNLFSVTMKQAWASTFTFVSPDCTRQEELDAAFRPNTKAPLRRDHRQPGPDRAGY